MEMLIIHVVLTLDYAKWLQFCIMNSFTELKISVFKKNDYSSLFEHANNDAMDRLHISIYILATLFQTSQDRWITLTQALGMIFFKMFMDYVKHFYITRINKIPIQFYSGMRHEIFKRIDMLNKAE